MHDVLRVAMIQRLEQLSHVLGRCRLRERLILLFRDLVEEGLPCHVLHHQVHILLVVVRFVVLDNVGVVELVQNAHLLHDAVDIGTKLLFVEHLNGHLKVLVMLVRREEDAAEGTHTQHLRLRVNMVVLFKFVHALLLVSLAHLYRLLLQDSGLGLTAFRDSCT